MKSILILLLLGLVLSINVAAKSTNHSKIGRLASSGDRLIHFAY